MASIAIVPAAGRGSRFGGPKLLAPIGGVPMLDLTLRSVLEAGVDRLIVVVAPGAEWPGVTSIDDPRVELVVNPDPDRGMFSSIQAAADRAARAGPWMTVLILPADMPFVPPATIGRVLRQSQSTGGVVCPVFKGKRGHPVALPAAALELVRAAPADATLADVLDAAPGGRTELEVTDPGVLRDVDVPSDL